MTFPFQQIVSIDVGRTYSGYAIQFNTDYSKDDPTNKIYSPRTWNDGKIQVASTKIPSCLLLTSDGDIDSFGYEAETKFAALCDNGKQESWYFFKRFKMKIEDQQVMSTLSSTTLITDETNKEFPAEQVFAKFIFGLRSLLMLELNKDSGSHMVYEKDIVYVFTVPAFWSENAIDFIRNAAKISGIPEECLITTPEPESAALYCQYLPVARFSVGGEMKLSLAAPGTVYMIVDLGGVTDITVHTKLENGTSRTIHSACGVPWGGISVDGFFIQLLSTLITPMAMSEFINKRSADNLNMMRQFEIIKRSIDSRPDRTYNIKIPASLFEITEKRLKTSFKEAVSHSSHASILEVVGDELRMNAREVKGLVLRAIDKIAGKIQQCIDDFSKMSTQQAISSILLVGGFSESKYVQEKLKLRFKNSVGVNILIPEESGLSVLKGAVVYGRQVGSTLGHSVLQREIRYELPEDINKSKTIPVEILRMGKESIEQYNRALAEGEEEVYNIRVMIVGHFGVGKTVLTKRLMNEPYSIEQRVPTEGIDVHVGKVFVNLKDGNWIDNASDDEEQRYLLRQGKVLAQFPLKKDTGYADSNKESTESRTQDKKGHASDEQTTVGTPMSLLTLHESHSTVNADLPERPFSSMIGYFHTENHSLTNGQSGDGAIYQNNSNKAEDKLIEPEKLLTNEFVEKKCYQENPAAITKVERINIATNNQVYEEESNNTEDSREVELEKELLSLEDIKGRSPGIVEETKANLSIWDFAGQYAFYDTHQVFLSWRTIYLLVTDLSKRPDDTVEHDNCYIDSDGNRQWTVSDFANFWLNSIHEYSTEADPLARSFASKEDANKEIRPEDTRHVPECPPVILVGTFADKLEDITEGEARLDELEESLKKYKNNESSGSHLVKTHFVVDNLSKKDSLDKLRKTIIKMAKKQRYWGERMPARWIQLEKMLNKKKIGGTKILDKETLEKINKDLIHPIETQDQMKLFLKFHHESGNIIHFSEDEHFKDTIVLDPEWLIDAFKSLHPHRDFFTQQIDTFHKWIDYDKYGILPKELIEYIWKKLDKREANWEQILMYLEKLGMLAKPDLNSSFFFAPSFVKVTVPNSILIPKYNERTSSKLCFTTSTGFLPSTVLNRILASFIAQYQPVYDKGMSKYLLFCGFGKFHVDKHSLYVMFQDNAIQIWLSRIDLEPDEAVCQKVKQFVDERMKKITKIDVRYFLKCPQTSFVLSDHKLKIEHPFQGTRIKLNCNLTLNPKQLSKFWFPEHQPTEMTDKKHGSREKFKYNGRLVELENDEKEKIAKYCGGNTVFAVLRKIQALKSEGFGMEVAITRIKIDDETKQQHAMKKVHASRFRHPFILPTYAIFEMDQVIYFVSPYCKNGDLFSILNQCRHTTKCSCLKLNEVQRIRIAFHIALGIQYLHTPLDDSFLVHGGISTKNIVLDRELNARLIDFKQSEMVIEKLTDVVIQSQDSDSIDKDKVSEASENVCVSKRKKDYTDFAKVIEEMMSGSFTGEDSDTRSTLDKIVQSCKIAKTYGDFKEHVVDKLQWLLRQCDSHNIIVRSKTQRMKRCDVCMTNQVADNLFKNHMASCSQNMEICTACDYNSYCAPLACFSCGMSVKPFLGQNWGALLIAGEGANTSELDGGEENAFKKDVEDVENVIHSGAIRICEGNVEKILSDGTELLPKIQSSLQRLQDNKVQNILLYFSCHGLIGKPDKTGSICKTQETDETLDPREICDQGQSVNQVRTCKTISTSDLKANNSFAIGSKNVTVDQLSEELERMEDIETFVIILDRCYAPSIHLRKGNIIQINSCGPQETSEASIEQSKFTKYFVKALEGSSCQDSKCDLCRRYFCMNENGYLSVESVFVYIKDHLARTYSAQTPTLHIGGSKVHFAYKKSRDSECDIRSLEDKLKSIEF